MNSTTIPLFALLAILGITLAIARPKRMRGPVLSAHAAALRSINTDPSAAINYAANPFRAGAYVYVMEAGQPSEHDWQGTYIGMQDGYALIRDQSTHIVATVNKDQVYSAHH